MEAMIAAAQRLPGNPGPGLSPEGSGAPEFKVHFSRPTTTTSTRMEAESNSFRWTGSGTLKIFERGLLVIARRRFPMGLRGPDERFVPASEIADVYREGNSVRVEIQGLDRRREFFQFWSRDAVTAGTIVRLLPTTRTIEYDESSGGHASARASALPAGPRRSKRAVLVKSLLVALFVTAALVATDIAMRRDAPKPTATRATGVGIQTTPGEFAVALADIHRFDDRIDALRMQCRTAFLALQTGNLSQPDFIDGINRWLIPQWRGLLTELSANPPVKGTLDSKVRQHLIDTVLDWDGGLADYAAGLKNQSYTAVIAAFDRMSAGDEAQRQAWRVLDNAESTLSNQGASRSSN